MPADPAVAEGRRDIHWWDGMEDNLKCRLTQLGSAETRTRGDDPARYTAAAGKQLLLGKSRRGTCDPNFTATSQQQRRQNEQEESLYLL